MGDYRSPSLEFALSIVLTSSSVSFSHSSTMTASSDVQSLCVITTFNWFADRYALSFSRRLIHATIRTKMSHQDETSNSGSNLHSYPNSDEKVVTLLYYKDSRVKIGRAEAFRSPLSPFTDHLHLRMPPKKEAVQITSNQSCCRCRRHQAKCLRSVCKQRPTRRRPRQR